MSVLTLISIGFMVPPTCYAFYGRPVSLWPHRLSHQPRCRSVPTASVMSSFQNLDENLIPIIYYLCQTCSCNKRLLRTSSFLPPLSTPGDIISGIMPIAKIPTWNVQYIPYPIIASSTAKPIASSLIRNDASLRLFVDSITVFSQKPHHETRCWSNWHFSAMNMEIFSASMAPGSCGFSLSILIHVPATKTVI